MSYLICEFVVIWYQHPTLSSWSVYGASGAHNLSISTKEAATSAFTCLSLCKSSDLSSNCFATLCKESASTTSWSHSESSLCRFWCHISHYIAAISRHPLVIFLATRSFVFLGIFGLNYFAPYSTHPAVISSPWILASRVPSRFTVHFHQTRVEKSSYKRSCGISSDINGDKRRDKYVYIYLLGRSFDCERVWCYSDIDGQNFINLTTTSIPTAIPLIQKAGSTPNL